MCFTRMLHCIFKLQPGTLLSLHLFVTDSPLPKITEDSDSEMNPATTTTSTTTATSSSVNDEEISYRELFEAAFKRRLFRLLLSTVV